MTASHTMDSSILKYLSNHRTILCMLCKEHYCIPPGGVRDHLYRCHQDKLTKQERAELVKFAGSLDLAHPGAIKIPPREDGPVPLLHKEKGCECLTCGYCCPKDTSMIEHGKLH